jgi:cation diffusion facilitator family transporter
MSPPQPAAVAFVSPAAPTRPPLARYAWLSVAAAVVTIGLKASAYAMTGSVGLLSDALESVVNLVAALVAVGAIHVASRPSSEDYAHGYAKIEYFSSGVEGTLIMVAAVGIAAAAAERLVHPRELEELGVGLAISVGASLVNLATARVLLRAGKREGSIVLEADGHHLMTDVWTSVGVVIGVAGVALTGLRWLDPALAILVAVQIVVSGVRLVRRSVSGLLDASLPGEERAVVAGILDRHAHAGVRWHALRTRQAGSRSFVTVHVLVPGTWTVNRGHALLEQIEEEIRAALPRVTVVTHLEPVEDPASWEDQGLDRQ